MTTDHPHPMREAFARALDLTLTTSLPETAKQLTNAGLCLRNLLLHGAEESTLRQGVKEVLTFAALLKDAVNAVTRVTVSVSEALRDGDLEGCGEVAAVKTVKEGRQEAKLAGARARGAGKSWLDAPMEHAEDWLKGWREADQLLASLPVAADIELPTPKPFPSAGPSPEVQEAARELRANRAMQPGREDLPAEG